MHILLIYGIKIKFRKTKVVPINLSVLQKNCALKVTGRPVSKLPLVCVCVIRTLTATITNRLIAKCYLQDV